MSLSQLDTWLETQTDVVGQEQHAEPDEQDARDELDRPEPVARPDMAAVKRPKASPTRTNGTASPSE